MTVSHLSNWFAKNEAESILTEDDLDNGEYTSYVFDKSQNCFVAEKDDDGNDVHYVADDEETADNFKKISRMMGAVDLAGDVVDVATAGWGTSLLSKSGKTVTKTVTTETVEEVVEDSAKAAAKQAVKEGAKSSVKEGVEAVAEGSLKSAVKQAVKETTEEAVEEAAETSAKTAAKEAAEEGAKETAKEAAKSTAKSAAKEAVKEGAEETAEKAAEEGAKTVVKKTVTTTTETAAEKSLSKSFGEAVSKSGKAVALATLSDRVLSGQTVSDYEMNGSDYAGTQIVKDVACLSADVSEDVTAGAASSVFNGFLRNHPTLGKFVNTCRAGYSASVKSLAASGIGSYAVAMVEKSADAVESWAMSTDGKYKGMGLSEVAAKLQSENSEDGKTWSQRYVERVKSLDAELGIDSSERYLVKSMDDKSADGVAFS
jgi:hypothetical protein